MITGVGKVNATVMATIVILAKTANALLIMGLLELLIQMVNKLHRIGTVKQRDMDVFHKQK